jgi:hypothetical protein
MIEKGYFHLELGNGDVLDIGSISKEDWRKIDTMSKQVIEAGQTTNAKIAFVAAFLHFYMQMQEMNRKFEKMN